MGASKILLALVLFREWIMDGKLANLDLRLNINVNDDDKIDKIAYADGACRGNQRGAQNKGALAIFIPTTQQYFAMVVDRTTNNLMEFGAGLAAVKVLSSVFGDSFKIKCDCNLLVEQLQRGFMKEPSLYKILKLILLHPGVRIGKTFGVGQPQETKIKFEHIRSLKVGGKEKRNYADLVCNAAIEESVVTGQTVFSSIPDIKKTLDLNELRTLVTVG